MKKILILGIVVVAPSFFCLDSAQASQFRRSPSIYYNQENIPSYKLSRKNTIPRLNSLTNYKARRPFGRFEGRLAGSKGFKRRQRSKYPEYRQKTTKDLDPSTQALKGHFGRYNAPLKNASATVAKRHTSASDYAHRTANETKRIRSTASRHKTVKSKTHSKNHYRQYNPVLQNSSSLSLRWWKSRSYLEH